MQAKVEPVVPATIVNHSPPPAFDNRNVILLRDAALDRSWASSLLF